MYVARLNRECQIFLNIYVPIIKETISIYIYIYIDYIYRFYIYNLSFIIGTYILYISIIILQNIVPAESVT